MVCVRCEHNYTPPMDEVKGMPGHFIKGCRAFKNGADCSTYESNFLDPNRKNDSVPYCETDEVGKDTVELIDLCEKCEITCGDKQRGN